MNYLLSRSYYKIYYILFVILVISYVTHLTVRSAYYLYIVLSCRNRYVTEDKYFLNSNTLVISGTLIYVLFIKSHTPTQKPWFLFQLVLLLKFIIKILHFCYIVERCYYNLLSFCKSLTNNINYFLKLCIVFKHCVLDFNCFKSHTPAQKPWFLFFFR